MKVEGDVVSDLLNLFAAVIAEKIAANLRIHPAQPPKLYTVKQVAEIIGRSTGAVQHLIARGELPAVRNGRRVHVAAEDLERWIKENRG